MEEFHKVRRLPPYVFEQVNRIKAAARANGAGAAFLRDFVEEAKTSGFVAGLADGSLRVVDLTTPLSAATPALRLPAPFANLIDFSLEEVSAYNEPGPYWRHNNIHTGEHIGTHLDAPIHWISGRDGDDVSQIPVQRLIGPAAVLDLTDEVADDPDHLLSVAEVEAWEIEQPSAS